MRSPDPGAPGRGTSGITIHLNGLEAWPDLAAAREPMVDAARAAITTDPRLAAGELSITFVADAEMTRLNAEWFDREGTTDVIAFSLGTTDSLLGDIYIAPATAGRNAARFGVEPTEEMLRLVIHGTLHVLGYDHPEGADRDVSEMFRLQEELLRGLGVS